MSANDAQVIPIRRPKHPTARCLYCGNNVQISGDTYNAHSVTAGKWNDTCPMTGEPVPVTGITEADHEQRVELVTYLAWRLRDEDPRDVWLYLTSLPAEEVQRLLVLALAAIPVDRSVDDLFEWVRELVDAPAVEATTP